MLVGCTLGLATLSSFAVTIDEVVSDMSSKSEVIAIDPRYEWQYQPAIVMHAPRGDAIPSWWTGNRPEWTYSVLTWFTTQEAQGNAATNSRVQVANLRFYVLSQATRTWKQLDTKAAPYSEMWSYPFAYAGAGSVRSESSGGVSIKPDYPNFYHGYGNPISIDPKDVRAVYVSMDFRLAVENTSKPDDRDSAKYVVNAGADYWPGNGQATWSLGYAPGIGTGRTKLATKDWRTATLLVPNKNYGSTMEEIRQNPPPSVTGIGGTTATTTTTTKAAVTTTAAMTTTTKSATTTTKSGTTTTASVTTTTAPINTGTSGTPVSTSAYAAVTAKNSGKCLDVSARSNADGGAIVQWACNGQDNQKWAMRDMGGAQYQLVARNSGKCLDTRGATANGAAIVQNACGTSAQQLWTRRTSTSGHSQLVSVANGKCLNVRGYSSRDGAIIEQNACTNSDSQQWSLPVSAPQPSTPQLSGAQAITAKHSGKCVDLSAWSNANGVQMQQWSCNGGTNQQWLFKDVGNARYQIVSKTSGKCLDVKDGNTADGAIVQQMDCQAGATKQQWTFLPENGGYNKLKSVASGKCMDVTAMSTADGAKLVQWSCSATNASGGDNQRWMIH
ncbi:hypothetical protein D3878_22295 [Noviherbaspirillum sedimenti]|uniref:Ricin B lectin domain-containing protein n=1 Tax=Noviherbaspirillum sedimenti TaxID=2320865 RepID=A0A3A3GSM5_9BURK|nr:hypothetical protein D3878_22295 [Noviherbaspirillum sedimenti]